MVLVCLHMCGIPRALGCSAYLSVWQEVGVKADNERFKEFTIIIYLKIK